MALFILIAYSFVCSLETGLHHEHLAGVFILICYCIKRKKEKKNALGTYGGVVNTA